jgi:hypothetical protein
VAGREPLVLVEHLGRVVAEPLARLEVLGELLDHRLDQRRQRERVLDARLGVHGAHLDGAEVRVRADVVPEVGVVLDHARLDHEVDALLVVGPVRVGGWDADAREGAEDRHAGGVEAGAVPAPERRVGRQREQDRHVHPHPVGDVDGLLGVVDADVDVQAEDDLLPGDEAQRRDQVAVARAGDDPLVLPARERVGARRADQQVTALGGVGDVAAQVAQLLGGLGGVVARLGGDLEHRLHQLRLDLPRRRLVEERLDRVREREGVGIDDHQLLLDADRVARTPESGLHWPGSLAWLELHGFAGDSLANTSREG